MLSSAVVLAAVSAVAAGSAACDQGHQDDASVIGGPSVHLIGQNVGTNKTLPVNGRIELAFDRYLDPLTVTRQAFQLADAFGNAVASPEVEYDPVVRQVVLTAPAGVDPWLVVNQPYVLTVVQAPNGLDGSGVRAVDHAALDAPVIIGFQTTKASATPYTEPTISFCGDILPVFQRSCSASNCHGTESAGGDPTRTGTGSSFPAEALVLASDVGVAMTAIGRVANEANTGAHSGTPGAYPGLFGADYAIIAKEHPEESWLLYKCLLAAPGDGVTAAASGTDCSGKTLTPTTVTFGTANTAATDDERANLANVIEGNSMPYPYFSADGTVSASGTSALTLLELERLRLWIKQGAPTPSCTVCSN